MTVGGLGSPGKAISGKAIFPLGQFKLALCSSPAKSSLAEPCLSVPKDSANFTFICQPTSLVSLDCVSFSPTAFQQPLMNNSAMDSSGILSNMMSNSTSSTGTTKQ